MKGNFTLPFIIIFRPSLFLRSSSFLYCHNFSSCLNLWDRLIFWFVFIFGIILIFGVIFIFGVILISRVILILGSSSFLGSLHFWGHLPSFSYLRLSLKSYFFYYWITKWSSIFQGFYWCHWTIEQLNKTCSLTKVSAIGTVSDTLAKLISFCQTVHMQTQKKSQSCKPCLLTIFAKIVDIFV